MVADQSFGATRNRRARGDVLVAEVALLPVIGRLGEDALGWKADGLGGEERLDDRLGPERD